ncbi:hypothetical protein ACFE04_014244 [Oxalis oulophora]
MASQILLIKKGYAINIAAPLLIIMLFVFSSSFMIIIANANANPTTCREQWENINRNCRTYFNSSVSDTPHATPTPTASCCEDYINSLSHELFDICKCGIMKREKINSTIFESLHKTCLPSQENTDLYSECLPLTKNESLTSFPANQGTLEWRSCCSNIP